MPIRNIRQMKPNSNTHKCYLALDPKYKPVELLLSAGDQKRRQDDMAETNTIQEIVTEICSQNGTNFVSEEDTPVIHTPILQKN